jgi:hypothetical protein
MASLSPCLAINNIVTFEEEEEEEEEISRLFIWFPVDEDGGSGPFFFLLVPWPKEYYTACV